MTVKNILISQPEPQTPSSPYSFLSEQYGVKVDFRPFFRIEPLSSREFRGQRINVLEHTAIVFSSKSTIDAFFHLCEELRVKIPETMKYFCSTESVAKYLQKHIVYRKRKIFFGNGTPESIIAEIGAKHSVENFLITTSDTNVNDITKAFDKAGMKYDSAIYVKSVSQEVKDVKLDSYDVIVLYNKADVKSLYENFPDYKPASGTKFITFGKSVVKAMEEAGLDIAIAAPTAEAPSAVKAIEIYINQNK